MTHDEVNAEHWEPIFADAVRKVAPTSAKVYEKVIMGLQAERDLFERKNEEMAAELATLKQRKMAGGKFMNSEFRLGWICGTVACAVVFLIERGLIR